MTPIFVKTHDFTIWLLELTGRFPKSQRFVMEKRIEDAILNFHDAIIFATKGNGKATALNKADYELERLKHYFLKQGHIPLLSG